MKHQDIEALLSNLQTYEADTERRMWSFHARMALEYSDRRGVHKDVAGLKATADELVAIRAAIQHIHTFMSGRAPMPSAPRKSPADE